MPQGTYSDKYLSRFVTDAIEARAVAYVEALGPFAIDANDWSGRLTSFRVYVETCLECQAQADDVFARKLSSYRTEFDDLLKIAKAATRAKQAQDAAASGSQSAGLFSVNIARG